MRSHKAHRLRSAGLCFHAKLSAALALHALYALRSTIPVPQPCEAPGRARRLVDEDSWALGSDLKDLHVFSAQALSWDPCSQSRVPFSHVLRAGARPESMKRLPTVGHWASTTRCLKSTTDCGPQSSSRRLLSAVHGTRGVSRPDASHTRRSFRCGVRLRHLYKSERGSWASAATFGSF